MKSLFQSAKLLAGASVVIIAAGMSSCGREAPRAAGPTPIVAPAPQPEPAPSEAPGTPRENKTPAGTSTSVAEGGEGAETASLLWQILNGQHSNVNDGDRARLVTQEAQRCRQEGAVFVPTSLGFVAADPQGLIAAYQLRHRFPNPLDACRRDLWLLTSVGPTMKRENLVSLENCNRLAQLDKISDPNERNAAADLIMVESISLLCGLPAEGLNPELQSALADGFIRSWTRRSQF